MAATEAELTGTADAVFVGTVTREVLTSPHRSSNDPVLTTFAVESVLKGQVGGETTVHSVVDSASCGITFAAGLRYRVHAQHRDGRLSTNICMGSRQLTDTAVTTNTPAKRSAEHGALVATLVVFAAAAGTWLILRRSRR